MTRLDSAFMGPPARSSRALARRLRSSGWVAHRARLGSCFLLAIGTVALLACVDDHWYRQDGKRVVGYMDFPEYAAELGIGPQIPDKATATVPLEITFWTTGLGCDEGGDTEVVVHGRTAVVTPYDFLDVWPSCYLIGVYFEHKANVVFDDPGLAEIKLRYSTTHDDDRKPDGEKVYTVEVSPAG